MKDKKIRQYRSRQGRSDKKYSDSLIALAISIVGLIASVIIVSLI